MLRAHAEADPALRRTALGSLRGRKEHGRMGPEIGLLKARNGHTTAQIVEKIFPSSPCVLQLDSGFPWDAFLKKKRQAQGYAINTPCGGAVLQREEARGAMESNAQSHHL